MLAQIDDSSALVATGGDSTGHPWLILLSLACFIAAICLHIAGDARMKTTWHDDRPRSRECEACEWDKAWLDWERNGGPEPQERVALPSHTCRRGHP